MKALIRSLRVLSALFAICVSSAAIADEPNSTNDLETEMSDGPIIDHEVVDIYGETVSLADYRGSAMLIVNTASECGFTPQLGGLEELYQTYRERGLVVLGFPCNDFGGQEPGENEEIVSFCSNEYGTTFPLFDKVSIRGDEPHPLYETLQQDTAAGISGPVAWNFTKFLVDPQGRVVARFESAVTPQSEELISAIEAVLPR